MSDLSPYNVPLPSQKATTRGKFFLYFLIIALLLGASWLGQRPTVQATLIEWQDHTICENIKRLTGGDNKPLIGENEGRINFLILGQGGSKHDGPYLTDTIIFASLKTDGPELALLSLPRDLVVKVPDWGLKKINFANALGEEKGKGEGAKLAVQTVADLLNQPIHYYVRLSFSGFAKIVDDIGGVPVEVSKSFTDNNYPSDNNGLMTIKFDEGWKLLNGEEALQFARSRHGGNGESSDFARAALQQKLLLALKDKLLSPATLLNPRLVLKLYRNISSSLETDLSAQSALRLVDLLSQLEKNEIVNRVLDTSPTGLLHETIGEDGAYLLLLNDPSGKELKETAANIFNLNLVGREQAKIILENGTTEAGLAGATADSLKILGLNILEYKNATIQNLTRTEIYDYTAGKKPITKQTLESLFKTSAINSSLSNVTPNTDFRVILGTDRLLKSK